MVEFNHLHILSIQILRNIHFMCISITTTFLNYYFSPSIILEFLRGRTIYSRIFDPYHAVYYVTGLKTNLLVWFIQYTVLLVLFITHLPT